MALSLLGPPPDSLAIFVDLFIFFSYLVMAGFLLYIGRYVSLQKKITLPWLILSIGFLFSSLNLFVEVVGILTEVYIIPRPILWYIFNTIGSIALIIGFASVMVERQLEMSVLKRRQLEIKDIMQYLKESYYKKELSEDDLRRFYADLVEHLAEIEVKIKTLEKEKKKKK